METNGQTTKSALGARLLYSILFIIIFSVAEMIIYLVMGLQFLLAFVSGHPNERLCAFGEHLGIFVRQIIEFLTFQADQAPFPFAPWPNDSNGETPPPKTIEAQSS